MKEFFKSQWLILTGWAFSLGILILLVWLDGYQNFWVLGYALLLVLVVLVVVVLIHYFTNKSFYHYLQTGQKLSIHKGYLAKKWQKQFNKDYQHYQSELAEIQQHHQNHVKFMNIWTHQMKTPVSVLALMAESGQVDVYDILAETDRLKTGLSTALNFVRLEDFKEDFILEKCSVLALVKESISEQKRFFIRQEVYPKLAHQEDFFVTTDKKWFQILLFQLISNSIKYSNPKGTVVFELNANDQSLKIIDQGCGIPPGDLPRVFRPFFTGDNGRKKGEATGMGLYLAEMIGEKLAIQLSIRSEVHQGTEIQVTFKEKN